MQTPLQVPHGLSSQVPKKATWAPLPGPPDCHRLATTGLKPSSPGPPRPIWMADQPPVAVVPGGKHVTCPQTAAAALTLLLHPLRPSCPQPTSHRARLLNPVRATPASSPESLAGPGHLPQTLPVQPHSVRQASRMRTRARLPPLSCSALSAVSYSSPRYLQGPVRRPDAQRGGHEAQPTELQERGSWRSRRRPGAWA